MKTQNPFDTTELDKKTKVIKMKESKWRCLICNKSYLKGACCVENHFRKVHEDVKIIYKEDEDDEEISNWDLVYMNEKDKKRVYLLEGIIKERIRLKAEVEKILEDVDLELLFTDIKDRKGNKFELSDELMEMFRTFWEIHLEPLIKQKLGLGTIKEEKCLNKKM